MSWNCKYYRERDADDCYGLYTTTHTCCGNCLSWIDGKRKEREKVNTYYDKEFDKWDRWMKGNKGVWVE